MKLVRQIEPSDLMSRSFWRMAREAERLYGGFEYPAPDKRWVIDPATVNGLQVLQCFEAKRHRDEDFGWTALWCLRTTGHLLYLQEKLRSEVESVPLFAGSVTVFASHLHWHWTNKPKGLLVVATQEFGSDPPDADVREAFDADLVAGTP